jgi:hypothetical protein
MLFCVVFKHSGWLVLLCCLHFIVAEIKYWLCGGGWWVVWWIARYCVGFWVFDRSGSALDSISQVHTNPHFSRPFVDQI